MSFFNKSFWVGFVAGGVLSAIAVVVGLTVFSMMMLQKMNVNPATYMGAAPEFPESGPITPIRPGADWTFRDLSGSPHSLRDLRGKAVFLNKWATWCEPCKAEMPSIQALYDSLHTEGVEFALLSNEDPAKVRRFVETKGYHLPVYVYDGDAPGAYESRGIPATFILDKSGDVVVEHVGSANWDVVRCRSFLRRLVAR